MSRQLTISRIKCTFFDFDAYPHQSPCTSVPGIQFSRQFIFLILMRSRIIFLQLLFFVIYLRPLISFLQVIIGGQKSSTTLDLHHWQAVVCLPSKQYHGFANVIHSCPRCWTILVHIFYPLRTHLPRCGLFDRHWRTSLFRECEQVGFPCLSQLPASPMRSAQELQFHGPFFWSFSRTIR